jgi:hypothetical protein
MPNYNEYTADEFIQDPLFREWINNTDPASSSFWHQWISLRPPNLGEFLQAEEAFRMLVAIFGGEYAVNDDSLKSHG